jgi:ribosomal protein S27E
VHSSAARTEMALTEVTGDTEETGAFLRVPCGPCERPSV